MAIAIYLYGSYAAFSFYVVNVTGVAISSLTVLHLSNLIPNPLVYCVLKNLPTDVNCMILYSYLTRNCLSILYFQVNVNVGVE